MRSLPRTPRRHLTAPFALPLAACSDAPTPFALVEALLSGAPGAGAGFSPRPDAPTPWRSP